MFLFFTLLLSMREAFQARSSGTGTPANATLDRVHLSLSHKAISGIRPNTRSDQL